MYSVYFCYRSSRRSSFCGGFRLLTIGYTRYTFHVSCERHVCYHNRFLISGIHSKNHHSSYTELQVSSNRVTVFFQYSKSYSYIVFSNCLKLEMCLVYVSIIHYSIIVCEYISRDSIWIVDFQFNREKSAKNWHIIWNKLSTFTTL